MYGRNISDLDDREIGRISMAVRPSGSLHLGTLVTMLHSFLIMKENKEAYLDLRVNDVDFHFLQGECFVPFLTYKDESISDRPLKDHMIDELKMVSDEICRVLEIENTRVDIGYVSESTESSLFQKYIDNLFGTEEGNSILKNTLMPHNRVNVSNLLAPICKECGCSTIRYVNVNRETLDVDSRCYNKSCDVDAYTFPINEPSRLNYFYLLTSLRDIVPDRRGNLADVHVYGGDYAEKYGVQKIPKAERVSMFLGELSDNPPLIHVGPLVTNASVKISKSASNGFKLNGSGYISNLMEKIIHITEENMGNSMIELSRYSDLYE